MNIRFGVAACLLSATSVVMLATCVKAAETKEVTRTVTVYNLKDDAPALYAKVKAICDDKSVKLSDKAQTACKAEEFPKLTKALKFRNAGIGAEFNTLAAQRD